MSPTLIGDGGHARDIMATLDTRIWRQIPHHEGFDPYADPYILGINDPNTRAKIASGYLRNDLSWIHPNAYIGPDCEIDLGTHINYGVTMTRTIIGHHCTIAPGVTICGDVTIGDRVFIGAGATIVNLTRIPDDTFIKAGTVWTER